MNSVNLYENIKNNWYDKEIPKIENCYIPFIKGIITPHAGQEYISPSIEKIIKYVNFKYYEKIIILSTNHYLWENSISPKAEFLKTTKRNYKLKTLETENILTNTESFTGHSLKVEHSFLHVFKILDHVEINKNLEIILILVGKNYDNLYDLLKKELTKKTLIWANTDLNHSNTNKELEDKITLDKIVRNELSFDNKSLCGLFSTKLMINLMKDNFNLVYPRLYSSYLVSKTKYVGYMDGFYVPKFTLKMIPKLVINIIRKNKISNYSDNLINEIDKFLVILDNKKPYGAFVSLFNGKELRGCVGLFNDLKTSARRNIIKSTLRSYFSDSRFRYKPIKSNEKLRYKINLIHPSESIDTNIIEEYYKKNLGKYGLTLYFQDGTRATFLALVIKEILDKNNGNFNEIIKKLAEKSGCRNCKIEKAEKYICEEL